MEHDKTAMRSNHKDAPTFRPSAPEQAGRRSPMPETLASTGGGEPEHETRLEVGLLTGGDDRWYAIGLASALTEQGIFVDFIGSNAVDGPELHNTPLVKFLNLRGDQSERASIDKKVSRLLAYYGKLIRYAAVARPRIFHILWNNKFELIDRTVLMLYYRLLGKKIVFTAHNVNAAKRDRRDSFLNRASLRIQYRLSDHILVHTEKMKQELSSDFGVPAGRVSVIPFGINNVIPQTQLTRTEARQRLGLDANEPAILFFGQIAPYKGLEYLVAAMAELAKGGNPPRLIIAGRAKRGHMEYWEKIRSEIDRTGIREKVIEQSRFIPDGEVEVYFKAADAMIMPYTDIFQSGVLFLAVSFGLPVIATDVGSFRECVIDGKTGFICKPRDPVDLARSIGAYFSSSLYRNLESRCREIRDFANRKFSWTRVGEITRDVYKGLLARK